MREYIKTNIKIIKKHFKTRKKVISKINKLSINAEYKEWNTDVLPKEDSIWTLPDLTRTERLKNFCRSIKKEIK
tara:strand:+ start:43 stop:264 length:222 start_codon:yes stop_codon:yes gene_type:complete